MYACATYEHFPGQIHSMQLHISDGWHYWWMTWFADMVLTWFDIIKTTSTSLGSLQQWKAYLFLSYAQIHSACLSKVDLSFGKAFTWGWVCLKQIESNTGLSRAPTLKAKEKECTYSFQYLKRRSTSCKTLLWWSSVNGTHMHVLEPWGMLWSAGSCYLRTFFAWSQHKGCTHNLREYAMIYIYT